jgi:pantothenate kinase-related protein Tda10
MMDSSSYYPDKFKKVDETVSSVLEERDALRAEVERLKADTQEENDKLSLAAFRNLKQHLYLECDKIAQAYDIRFSSEKQLRADLAAAVEVLRELEDGIDDYWPTTSEGKPVMERYRAFLARMEVNDER